MGIENIPAINPATAGQIAPGNSGGKPIYAFGWLPLEWSAGGQMALPSAAPLAKSIPALISGSGKSGGLADKFLQAVMSIPDDLRGRAQQAGVMYSGDLPSGPLPSGGGAIYAVSGPSSGGFSYDV